MCRWLILECREIACSNHTMMVLCFHDDRRIALLYLRDSWGVVCDE